MRAYVVAGTVLGALLPGAGPAGAAQQATLAYSADRTAIFVALTDGPETLRLSSLFGGSGRVTFAVTPGGATTSDPACVENSAGLHCDVTGVTRVYVLMGAGNDVLNSAEDPQGIFRRLVVQGGAGNDLLQGTELADWLVGDDGRDRIAGNGGADILDGAAGDDEVLGGAGSDDLRGGAGVDTVSYAYMTKPVNVDMGCGCGVSGDFEGGERDVIRAGVENARGGAGPDRLVGNGAGNRLIGGPGNDLLYGMGGPDVLPIEGDDWAFGGTGYDVVTYDGAAEGVDVRLNERPDDSPGRANVRADVEQVTGSRFADRLFGDDRPNVLRGGAGDDELVGFGGDDLLIGDAGADILVGGTGRDRCVGDAQDAYRSPTCA